MIQKYNSTIGIKKKQLRCGCYDYAFSKGRCKTHATIEDTEKRFAKEDTEPVEDLSGLIEDIDTVLSRLVRIGYADSEGMVQCFTCDKPSMHFTLIQNGHYVSRQNLSTRFLKENCRPQCEDCNCFKHGNLKEFKERLDKEQNGLSDWLTEQGRLISKPTKWELKELLVTYRQQLKTVQLKLKK